MGRRGEQVVKSRAGWHKADQVKRIRIVMTVVAVALCISVAAGAVLAWVEIRHPFGGASSQSASLASSRQEEALPVYEDSYNLLLVNASHALQADFRVRGQAVDGVTVDERIVPALQEMMHAAQEAGSPLKLAGGYVNREEQDKLFQAEVARLKKSGYSQVRAENQAQSVIGRGGYNERQTGMSVRFTAPDLKKDAGFSATAQYRWLVRSSVNYGFVPRYTETKESITGVRADPGAFRYVGTENALKMRALGMCLEEYVGYARQQG